MKIGISSGFCPLVLGATQTCRTLGRNLQPEALNMVTRLTLQDSLNVPWRTSRVSCLKAFQWSPGIEGILGVRQHPKRELHHYDIKCRIQGSQGNLHGVDSRRALTAAY